MMEEDKEYMMRQEDSYMWTQKILYCENIYSKDSASFCRKSIRLIIFK